MFNLPILSVTIFLPLLGAIIILFIQENEISKNNFKLAALITSLGSFILSCVIWFLFDPLRSEYQLTENYKWFYDFNYYVGVDGISIFMILLTTFLIPLCILSSWDNIKFRIKEYMIDFLLLETFVL